MTVLSLSITADPGHAQVASTAMPPDTTAPSILTQADALRSPIGEQPVSSPQEDPNAGLRIPPNFAEDFPIQRVFIYLRNPTGDAEQDDAVRQQLAEAFRIQAGGNFSPLFADQGLNEVRQLPFVESAEYRTYRSNLPGSVIVALLVTLQPDVSAPPPKNPQRLANPADS